MSRILNLRGTENTEEYIVETIEALRAGQLVVIPTETVYGLAALASNESAVKHLMKVKGRKLGHALPVAISGLSELHRYIPDIDVMSERLARRCWPGPLTLVMSDPTREGELYRLPDWVQKAVMPKGSVGFRVPRHDFFLKVLRQLDEPLVLTSANLSGEQPAVNANDAMSYFTTDQLVQNAVLSNIDGTTKDDSDSFLYIDDGPAYFKTPSSVVQVIGPNQLEVIREGAITKDNIHRLTAKIILFVCTGNTCRSPMAEMLCARALANRLDCDIADLENYNYVVMSAGVATMGAAPVSDGAREAVKEYGVSLDHHESQPVTDSLLQFADLIFVMGRAHKEAVLNQRPETRDRIYLLRPDEQVITDPLGGDLDVYRECARQINSAIEDRMDLIL